MKKTRSFLSSTRARDLVAASALTAALVVAVTATGTAPKNKTAAAAKASAPAGDARSTLAVELVKSSQIAFNDTLGATGSIAAWQEASVSPQVPGLRVQSVLKNTGDTVRRGEVMLVFDDAALRAEAAQIQAGIAEAEAGVAEAAANAQRARQVRDSGALSGQQVQQMLTGEATARARLQALRESARLQALRLQHAQLHAPDDGIVSFRAAPLGAVVPAGFEMFRIIRQGRLEWRAEVPSSALPRLKPGQEVRLWGDGGTAASGTVRQLAPTVDPTTRNALVHVDLPAGTPLRPGMFARGELVLGEVVARALPQSAVLQRDGQHLVARVEGDGRVRFLAVTVGRRQGAMVEITGGLPPEAAVVASGAAFLFEGDAVRVVGAPQ